MRVFGLGCSWALTNAKNTARASKMRMCMGVYEGVQWDHEVTTGRCGILRRKAIMAAENFADSINSLTPDEQDSVRQFIDFLKLKGSSPSPSRFLGAVDEFIEQHPELLRRLAQ